MLTCDLTFRPNESVSELWERRVEKIKSLDGMEYKVDQSLVGVHRVVVISLSIFKSQ